MQVNSANDNDQNLPRQMDDRFGNMVQHARAEPNHNLWPGHKEYGAPHRSSVSTGHPEITRYLGFALKQSSRGCGRGEVTDETSGH